MALSFPNKSRAFDATRRAVRFWGHDSAMEVAFFVTEDALKRVEPLSFPKIASAHTDGNPDKIGVTIVVPDRWMDRRSSASLPNPRCVVSCSSPQIF